ncbi:MAG: hypothetical protein JNL33_12285 [Betaproteobacteria bacterium]|nr:hypothetical protein [Betaproteobacteria bacterium]
MDDVMNRRAMLTTLCPFVLALMTQAARAQSLPDPTRPPEGAVAAGAAAEKEGPQPLVLQSVLVGERRRIAVIGGTLVPLGGSVRGYTLTRVGEDDVTLTGPEGTLHLKLYGPVERRDVKLADVPPIRRTKTKRIHGS